MCINRVHKSGASSVVNCDPEGTETGVLRAPTGVQKDFLHCSTSGEPWYDPSLIQAPTQIVVGALDRETTPAQGSEVFQRLTGAAEKRMTVIGGGTHSLLLENQRAALYDVVSSFFRSGQAPQ
ncbi:MAG: alpha/beta hydrolase [Pseudomonadales bacterium]|jgi:pimeloyl-ACP methyl ester carboxylesterase|nr:alpha/beta hydrolase [Pseudomonadales bacterium]